MSIKKYIKYKFDIIFANIVFLIITIMTLFSFGISYKIFLRIAIINIIVGVVYLIYSYNKFLRTEKKLRLQVESIDKKYIISEVIEEPEYIEALTYFEILKLSQKSMRDEINKVEKSKREYKDYIEKWVHEIKNPIARIKLINENSNNSKDIILSLKEVDAFVEQVLFYARSSEVHKDYLIKELSLKNCINKVIIKNKELFILNAINIDIFEEDLKVYSDGIWLEFIINQIISNSIKYRKNDNPQIIVESKNIKNGVILSIYDNGIGIAESDINRIFEKGFSGENGRSRERSTGFGLYIVKSLCDKLGITIRAKSNINEFTVIELIFPKGNFSKF